MARRRRAVVRWAAGAAVAMCAMCATGVAAQAQPAIPLRKPTAAALAVQGPDSFTVRLWTRKGAFMAFVRRQWSPRGSDRFFHLVRSRFYDGAFFFRVLPRYIAQVGYHADPAVTEAWDDFRIRDDTLVHKNTRGTISFATSGANTRTVQIFVNLSDNPELDARKFTPFAEVTEGMEAVDSLYSGYGEGAPMGSGPSQAEIATRGNAYLKKNFPLLDAIDSARIVERWPAAPAKPPAKPPAKAPAKKP